MDQSDLLRHLRDIAGVIRVCGNKLDRNYIEKWAAKLGVSDCWDGVLAQLDEA